MKIKIVRKKEGDVTEKIKKILFGLAIALGVLVLFYACYKISQKVYRQNEISVEINQLQSEIDRLENDNKDLQELSAYLQTQEFKEKEIKDKLNLVKEGEKVFLIKEHEIEKSVEFDNKKPEILVNRPNYYWWWHYFFSI